MNPSTDDIAKRSLWRVLALCLLLTFALVASIGWQFGNEIRLEMSRMRGAPRIERLGGSVPAWWTDAAQKGWLSVGQAAAGINLDGSSVVDDDLAVLAEFPNVYQVSLRHTAVTDAGLRYLRAMPKLTVVRLEGSAVTPAAAAELYAYLNERDSGKRRQVTDPASH